MKNSKRKNCKNFDSVRHVLQKFGVRNEHLALKAYPHIFQRNLASITLQIIMLICYVN